MKYFLWLIVIIIVILVIGNRLLILHELPNPNTKFTITNLQRQKDYFGQKPTYKATLQIQNWNNDVLIGNDSTVMEAQCNGYYVTLDGDIMTLEDFDWHLERHPHIKSISGFQDAADRLVLGATNFISDGIIGCVSAIEPNRYKYDILLIKVSPDNNNVISESEKLETKKNIQILRDNIGVDFVIKKLSRLK